MQPSWFVRFHAARPFDVRTIRVLLPLAAAVAIAGSIARAEPRDVRLAQAPSQQEAANEAESAESDAAEDARPEELPPGVEVLRVRARRTDAIDPEVPASITQFDATTIQALGAQNIADLSRVTPNVNIVQPGATQATFFVRGVGLSDFNSNAAGAVAIFQDGVALNAPAIQTGSLFDVEGVQIVLGPQGTGPFRNASAGAILVRSRRPSGNYTAQLRSSLGRYDTEGDKGAVSAWFQDYEGALEMPIAEEALSARFAFRLREGDPYKKNGCGNAIPFDERDVRQEQPGVPPGSRPVDQVDICGERDTSANGMIPPGRTSQIPVGLPAEVGDQHNWAARGTLRFQPPDSELDVALSLHGSRLDQHAALGQAIGLGSLGFGLGTFFGGPTAGGYIEPEIFAELQKFCGDLTPARACSQPNTAERFGKQLASGRPLDERPYRGDYNRVGQESRDSWGAFLSGAGTIADLEVSGLASYDGYERARDQDSDFTPDLLFEQTDEDEAWQTYEQLALAGELESEPLRWELGGLYLYEELAAIANTEIRLSSAFDRDYDQVIHAFGTWAEFEWDFLDDFTLGGGVRFNWERKDFRYTSQTVRRTIPIPPVSIDQSTTWQNPTGEITLTYHVGEAIATYAKYSRGTKAGHYNAVASDIIVEPRADEESNDAWEVGLRGDWLDRRLSATSAFFYYRYENYQVFLFRDRVAFPPALEIQNAKEAENYGAELEVQLQPLLRWAPRLIEGLRISSKFGWLHGEYLDFQSELERPAGGSQVLRIPIDFSGNNLQNSPEYKVSATVEWTLDLGRWGYLVPRYDVNWSDDVFFDPSEGRGTAVLKGLQPAAAPEYAIGQKAFALHNVRLAYRTPTGNVELAGFVRNLTDEVYKTFVFDAASFSGVVINFVGEPRTIGMELTVTF